MKITVELPDDIHKLENPGRVALEALVIAGFRAKPISEYQGRLLLGMDNKWKFWDFMGANNLESYTMEQLENDIAYINSQREQRVADR
jgi:hypothetical protein